MQETSGDREAGRVKTLILSDGRPGHYNQSVGIADNIKNSHNKFVEVKFKREVCDYILRLWCAVWSKTLDIIPGGKKLLRIFLKKDNLESLMRSEPDLIISAGSSLAGINLIMADIKNADSVVCMIPDLIGTTPFDLAVVPTHDDPPSDGNIVETLGAPNRITPQYIKQTREKWEKKLPFSPLEMPSPVIGIMLGGNNSYFQLTSEVCNNLLDELNEYRSETGGSVILTTSPRTPAKIENICRSDFAPFDDKEKFLILSDEWDMNPVPMILDVSDAVIVTEDSVSMVSEAVSVCGKVFVLELVSRGRGIPKTQKTLDELKEKGYIKLFSLLKGEDTSLEQLFNKGNMPFSEEGRLKEAEKAAKIIRERLLAGGK